MGKKYIACLNMYIYYGRLKKIINLKVHNWVCICSKGLEFCLHKSKNAFTYVQHVLAIENSSRSLVQWT